MGRFLAVRGAIVLALGMSGVLFYFDASTYLLGSFDPISGVAGPCLTPLELFLGDQPGSLRNMEFHTAADLFTLAGFEAIRTLRSAFSGCGRDPAV